MTVLRAWPGPRLDRAEGVPSTTTQAQAPTTGPVPRTRIWPFAIREVSGVAVVVSEPFTGPAIVEELVFHLDTSFLSPGVTFAIYKSLDGSGAGNNFPVVTQPSGTRLLDNLSNQRDDGTQFTDNLGIPSISQSSTAGYSRWPVKILVTDTTFFLKLRLAANNINGAGYTGYVRIIEGVSPDALANFL